MKPLMMDVKVSDVVQVAESIKRFEFERVGGGLFPTFSGGSHVLVEMDFGNHKHSNPYSLMGHPYKNDRYMISVALAENSRGGSRYMHEQVAPGMKMRLGMPINLFQLVWTARKHLMFAGGIGITPFMAQMAQLNGIAGQEFELYYSVRNQNTGAYCHEITERYGDRVHISCSEQDGHLDFDEILRYQPLGTHIYVCGPQPMIDAAFDAARRLGWHESVLHSEFFLAPAAGMPFDVELAQSGITVHVLGDQSILEAVEEAGVDAPCLCRGGSCGQCETAVLEMDGAIEHHDHFLSDEEKEACEAIMVCVSRFSGKRLVLDL